MFLAHVAPSFPEKAKVVFSVFFCLEDVWYAKQAHIIHHHTFTQLHTVIKRDTRSIDTD